MQTISDHGVRRSFSCPVGTSLAVPWCHRMTSMTEIRNREMTLQFYRSGNRVRAPFRRHSRKPACRAASQQTDASLPDDNHPVVAGIPVSVDLSTAVGERLWEALQRDSQEFVPLVLVELQQVISPPPPAPTFNHNTNHHTKYFTLRSRICLHLPIWDIYEERPLISNCRVACETFFLVMKKYVRRGGNL